MVEGEKLFMEQTEFTDYKVFIESLETFDCVDVSHVQAFDFSKPPLPNGFFQTRDRVYVKLRDICPLVPVILIISADKGITDPLEKLQVIIKRESFAQRVRNRHTYHTYHLLGPSLVERAGDLAHPYHLHLQLLRGRLR